MAVEKLNGFPMQSTMVSITRKSQKATLIKYGKIVWFSSDADFTSIPTGENIIGTIPDEYRPSVMTYGLLGNTNGKSFSRFVRFSANGNITMYSDTASSGASNGAITAMWITN